MKLLTNKKGMLITILSLVLVVVIAIGGTLAYFTDFDEKTNVFTMGKIKIDLDEPDWSDGDGLELLPGSSRNKNPTVTALEGRSYMRVRTEIVDGNGDLITDTNRINLILNTLYYDKAYGTPRASIAAGEKYSAAALQELIDQGMITKEYNTDAFAFAGIEAGNQAVRYYNYIANGGIFDAADPADTAVLFTNVIIPKDWHNSEVFDLNGDEYELSGNGSLEVTVRGSGYKIRISAQAIQAADMANASEAFAALDEATGVTRE